MKSHKGFRYLVLAGIMLALGATAGSAQMVPERSLYVHLGPALFDPAEAAEVTLGGAPVVGGNISINSSITAGFEIGYFLTEHLAVSIAGGLPPHAQVKGAGTLASAGLLGELTYGPAALNLHYHFMQSHRLQPYLGGGVARLFVFRTQDALVHNFKVDPSTGVTLQLGTDILINRRLGAFVDFKKGRLRTESSGSVGVAPMRSKVTLDPLVLHGGMTILF